MINKLKSEKQLYTAFRTVLFYRVREGMSIAAAIRKAISWIEHVFGNMDIVSLTLCGIMIKILRRIYIG